MKTPEQKAGQPTAGGCATVRVKSPVSEANPLGFIVIDEDDFDPKVHEKHEEAKPKAEEKDKAKK